MRLRIVKFGALIRQRDFCALDVECPHNPGAESLLLGFELLFQNPNGIFMDANFRAIEQQFVERDPYLHRDPVDDFLKLILLFLDVQSRDR